MTYEAWRLSFQNSEAAARSAYEQCCAAQEEAEALRKDALRYRWLRNDNAYFPEEHWISGGQDLDDAIDEEMTK